MSEKVDWEPNIFRIWPGKLQNMALILPCERNPTSTSLASMNIFGSTKQNAVTTWMKGAVGPPWCHADRTKPPDRRARMDGGSIAHALSL